ncbi:MAG: D-glycerate dehydrogenase, partial [Syntrophales bacterium]|nr:D-glycerate dehydrogenase [Syntrophales bacterium]
MQREKVLVTGNIPSIILDRLRHECDVVCHSVDIPMNRKDLLMKIADKDGIMSMITDRIDAEVFDAAPHLRIVANMGVGHNNIDVSEASSRSIIITNTPGVLTETTADLTFALILAVARRVVEGDRMVREGRFQFWAPFHFLGAEVSTKTLGIIGMGRIGRAVAKRARGFNMSILYYSRTRLAPEDEMETGAEFADLPALLNMSDFVTLHVPYSGDTKYLINEESLSSIKSTSFLINTSR